MPPRPRARGPRACLIVMVKVPVAGTVKTRLARSIGVAAATNFYRHALSSTLARVARPRAWTTVLAVSPDWAISSAALPAVFVRRKQGRGDLGRRLQRLIDATPAGPILIIGSDVPDVTALHIAQAFRVLSAHDLVFGPSPDGGYWLVGSRRRRAPLFSGVRWSTCHALTDTLANVSGRTTGFVARLADVDDGHDFLEHRGRIGRRIAAPVAAGTI